MRRKVTMLKLHDIAAVLPGVGSMEKQLPPLNKTIPMDMYLDSNYPGLVVVNIKGAEYFVSLANVQIGYLSPEEPKTEEKKAK